jgi:multicomponent Na+:H+ antiporter subunit B
MNLKKEIEVSTFIVSLIVSIMTILLLPIFLDFNLTLTSLGNSLIDLNLVQTGSANAVTSVVTYFRGLDTLGEVTVLFVSIFGIGLGLDRYREKLNIFAYENRLLKTAVDILFPLIILFGFYIIIHGHLTPGGGFQGGVIIASAFLLMFLAKHNDFTLNHKIISIAEALSGAGFILLGFLGVLLIDRFFGNFLPLGRVKTLFSGGVIPLIYIFVGVKVSAEMTALIDYFIRIKDVR